MQRSPGHVKTAIRQLERAELYLVAARSVDVGAELEHRLNELISELEDLRHDLRNAREVES